MYPYKLLTSYLLRQLVSLCKRLDHFLIKYAFGEDLANDNTEMVFKSLKGCILDLVGKVHINNKCENLSSRY